MTEAEARERIPAGGAAAVLRASVAPWVMVATELGTFDSGDSAGVVVDLEDGVEHHLRRVLRIHDGAEVVLTDGHGGLAHGRLTATGVKVDDVVSVPLSTPRLRVVQGVAKRSRHDEVVRMLTELGVQWITAATTTRSQVDLGRKVERVRARWDSIVVSACTQSRRAHRPVVDGPVSLAEALPGPLHRVLVAHPAATTNPLAAIDELAVMSAPATTAWTGVVGPEGGLTDDEVADLVDRGAIAVGLGSSVLRTEHAGLALAAVMAAGLGRM